MKKLITFMFVCLALAPLSAGEFKLPKFETVELGNGLTFYLMEQHEVPLIQFTASVRAGAVLDGQASGLSQMTGQGLLFGTKTWTKAQIEEELDFLGASINTWVNEDEANLSISMAARDWDKILPIAAEILTAPTFDEKEFEKQRQRELVDLERDRESPRAVIGSYFNKLIYGDQPYGNPISGLAATVSKMTADDLRGFYQKHYVPNATAIAVVGDFDTKTLKKQLKATFKGWKKGKKVAIDTGTEPKSFDAARVLLVNKNDARETTFYIGFPGVPVKNDDATELMVINTILGGRFTSWLNTELRVNSGLTYGARSSFDSFRDSGVFFVFSFTRTESTVEALDMALEVMARLHKPGIDQTTLDSAKQYVKGQFPPRYERLDSLAAFLTDIHTYGQDPSYINDFQKRVDALTLEKANALVAKYFPRENLQMVLVGKASEIRESVAKYGTVTEKEITTDGF